MCIGVSENVFPVNIAIQTFGDCLGSNPHCHVLCTDGGFYGKGMLRVAPWSGWQPCAPMSRIRGSRWSEIVDPL
ncbi:MAG: transposase [Deltaproteobacteria bacterium]|nr:transposase [Deltaproteobacteria bacterium]